ncbi:MAG: hypothetical protein U0136_07690 [Bdellovibrionota bacterium]
MDVTSVSAATQGPELSAKVPPPHLVNHGGKILENPKFVSIYYGPYWTSTAKGKSDADYLNHFGEYLVGSPHLGTWEEYGVKSASYGGSTFTRGTPQRVIDEHDVQQIVWNELRGQTVSPADGETVYTVYLPPGMELRAPDDTSSFDGLGGYHGSMLDRNGTPIYYAAIVYSQGENGIPFSEKPRDNITITASHEWAEAATDPDVNRSRIAWYDRNYGEVGDIPIAMGLPPEEIWGRLGGYAIQKEWSNRDNRPELVPKHADSVLDSTVQ